MKPIHKKNFFPGVCEVFTILTLSKIALEAVFQGEFGAYQTNIAVMFLLSLLATAVLSLHDRFREVPLPLVIVLQYLFLIGIVLGMVRVSSFMEPLHEHAYRDMFFSFTIPYVIGAILYYVSFFVKVRNANKYLMEIKQYKKDA